MKVDYIDNNNSDDEKDQILKPAGKRILVTTGGKVNTNPESLNEDVLIVVSKLKKYIKDKHGLNTSSEVCAKLSDIIRVVCDRAVDTAKQDGRKTLMDRDF